jgi:hypothetical protein
MGKTSWERKHVVSVVPLTIFMSLRNIKIYFLSVTSKIAEIKGATALTTNMFRVPRQNVFGK